MKEEIERGGLDFLMSNLILASVVIVFVVMVKQIEVKLERVVKGKSNFAMIN